MSAARARIHAMFRLNEQATAELDKRLDALVAEELRMAALDLDSRVSAGGPRARGLAFARSLLNHRAEGVVPTPPRRNIVHRDVAEKLRRTPGEWAPVGDYASSQSAYGIANMIRSGGGTIIAYEPVGAFDARVEVVDDGVRVFACYVGGETA
jgi:hypothetical protein